MNAKQAHVLLRSESTNERLAAARYFESHAMASDLGILKECLSREDVQWIKAALRKAIERCGSGQQFVPAPPIVADAVFDPAEREAVTVEKITRSILHEIQPIVGQVKVYARLDIPKYEGSKTARQLARLDKLLDAIMGLNTATGSPSYAEEDLAAIIDAVCESESTDLKVNMAPSGPRPLIVWIDAALLEIALRNGVRNAIEAYPADAESRSVIVTWQESDREVWITVLDRGIGPPALGDKAGEMGATTKRNHFGMGLYAAKQAMNSLGGVATLQPREGPGAQFELRWPKRPGVG